MDSHVADSDHEYGKEASQDEDDEDEDEDSLGGSDSAEENEVVMEEAPQETNGFVELGEEDLHDEDISENDPIHDYEPSELEDSQDSSSDAVDESDSEHDITAYKRAELIEEAQKLGLVFSDDGRLRASLVLACYVRHDILEMRGPFNSQDHDPLRQNWSYIPQFEDIPIVLSGGSFSRAGFLSPPVQNHGGPYRGFELWFAM